MSLRFVGVLFGCLACVLPATAADDTAKEAAVANTVCTFGNGQQMSIRYSPVKYDKGVSPSVGQPWRPGDKPIYLFSQTQLKVDKTTVPPGAYSLYIVPAKESWQVVINRNVQEGAKYDSSQDVAKIAAQTGKLPQPIGKLTLYFGRLSPETCALRIDYGPQRAYTDFVQQKK